MNYATPEILGYHAVFGPIVGFGSDHIVIDDVHHRIKAKVKDQLRYDLREGHFIYAKWIRINEDGYYYPTDRTEYKFFTSLSEDSESPYELKKRFRGDILEIDEFCRMLTCYDHDLDIKIHVFIPRWEPNCVVGKIIQAEGVLLHKSREFCVKWTGAFESSTDFMAVEH